MVEYTLTDEGEEYLSIKPPEVRLAELLSRQKDKMMNIKEARSHVSAFNIALLWAKKNGWVVISMKNDWKRIFAFETINEGGTDE